MLETALDATTDAVYMKSPSGRYVMRNRAAASNVSWPVDELIGRLDTEFFSPEDAATLHAVERKGLASGVATEDVMCTRQGARVFQSTRGVYLDGAGQPAGIFGSAATSPSNTGPKANTAGSKRHWSSPSRGSPTSIISVASCGSTTPSPNCAATPRRR